ncbi:L-rhamnose mutarotase [Tsuneonella flava]|uniref:L-rhamnose mutarotase n=1 Tax=Tsuneonella flava TaxID=2055955 RepID=A0ABX7KES5_9SPHN|nr:L-rhamnose mutarotase [Tsuneonella flava]QSB45205.1 L-rhamnose mutarotase [Tsuneonella flava]
MAIERRCLAVDLHNDAEMIAAYRRWHEPGGPPAAVSNAIRADGVISLQIWQIADRLFMIMEQDSELAPDPHVKKQRDAANPEVAEWDRMMAAFQRPLPSSPDQTWVEMERIYDLRDQP